MPNLHEAALRGDLSTLVHHINSGLAVDELRETCFTNSCSTALHVAAENGKLDCVQYLLSQGASAKFSDLWGHSAFHLAAQEGHADILQALTLKDASGVHVMDDMERTALHIAAEAGHIDCVKLLLGQGSHVDPAKTLSELEEPMATVSSAVHSAAAHGNTECLRLLQEAGGRSVVNLCDSFNRTPMHVAAAGGHIDCIKVLLQAGVDTTAQSSWGASPVHFAIKAKHCEAALLLIQHDSAAVDTPDNSGMRPLHWAAQQGCTDVVRALLAAGASLDAATRHACTAVSLAVECGQADSVRLLVQSGASLKELQDLSCDIEPSVRTVLKECVREISMAAVTSMMLFSRRRAQGCNSQALGIDMNHCILARIFNVEETFLRILLNTEAEGR